MDNVLASTPVPTFASMRASCETLHEWAELYTKRTAVERSISSFKYVLGAEQRMTFNSLTAKADIFLAGIVQLLCVVLADKLCQRHLFRRIRSLTG